MSRKDEKKNISFGPVAKDAIDATSLLKKLTPKLIKSGADLASRAEDEESLHGSDSPRTSGVALPGTSAKQPPQSSPSPAPTTGHTPPVPVGGAPAPEEDVPDWYEELSDDHVNAFKEVFDMLDASNTGTLNADSLFEGLRRVDSEITREEVESVLKTLDKDGNGEIDFDEFLFHISHSGAMDDGGDDEDSRKRRDAFTKRQRLFYSAITEFSIKRTLVDIQRAQMARVNQPHVLSHYTAGARLIGLTDRQLANEMKRMQKNMKNQDSPYAKPLQLVVSAGGRKTVRKAIRPRRRLTSIPTTSQVTVPAAVPSVSPVPVVPSPVPVPLSVPASIPKLNIQPATPKLAIWTGIYSKVKTFGTQEEEAKKDIKNIQDTVRMFTARDSVVCKLPDAHKILELRDKLAHGMVVEQEETPPVTTETAPPAPSTDKPERRRKRRMVTGWTIPRVDRDKVPLPVLKIKYKHHRPTIEDLPNIREKVAQAIDDYYESLRQATVKNAWEHWDKLYSHRIRSHKLMENFREVYRAYSPHKEEEAFVVCPWVPGPFRHIKHTHRCKTAGYIPTSPTRHRPNSRHDNSHHDNTRPSTSGRTSRTEQRPVSAF